MNHQTYARLLAYNSLLKEMDDIYRHIAKSFGISSCALWILYTLRVEPTPPTQSEIGRILYEPKQTVNSALKKMETDGLIEFFHGNNRKNKQIRLTEEGKALAKKSADKVIKAEYTALARLSDHEQENLIHLFQRYIHHLQENMQTLRHKAQ
ncbi:MAG: winged helix DNA-binding protein [Clostridiales bacterium]|nr:winged helix DNA-binding protein [Clostridiales bacterium]